MDRKDADRYPIWLMTDEFGTRGHDYRATESKPGICLVIASSFPDRRSRVQALLRVGRHTDTCYRVQSRYAKEIDVVQNGQRKALLYAAIKALEKANKPA